jgi:hypothetical protein
LELGETHPWTESHQIKGERAEKIRPGGVTFFPGKSLIDKDRIQIQTEPYPAESAYFAGALSVIFLLTRSFLLSASQIVAQNGCRLFGFCNRF